MSHRSFRLALVRNLLESAGKEKAIAQRSRGRPSPVSTNIGRLEGRNNEHWVEKGKRARCRLCSLQGKESRTIFKCSKCDNQNNVSGKQLRDQTNDALDLYMFLMEIRERLEGIVQNNNCKGIYMRQTKGKLKERIKEH
ncbi:hypothetical protein J437_LFUL018207, partial [Ladona fulva]